MLCMEGPTPNTRIETPNLRQDGLAGRNRVEDLACMGFGS